MCLPDKLSMLRDGRLTARTTDLTVLVIIGGQQCSASRTIGAAQLRLDRLPQVLKEMETISDLSRLWRSFPRALRIQSAAIAG